MMPGVKESDVLSRVVGEVRSEPIPELDWDRIEASLVERTGRPATLRSKSGPTWVRWTLAAAAAVVLGAIGARELIPSEPVRSMAKSAQRWNVEGTFTLDGSRLGVGQRVTSGTREVRVVHAGRTTWTLAPQSRGVIAIGGELLTVQLEQGAAFAEVVPSNRPESFAIEADALRAAAHGTAFRVSRAGDRVVVDVTEGIVAVGPASTRGATRGWLLTAPARGHFSLDGKSGQVEETPASTSSSTSGRVGAAPIGGAATGTTAEVAAGEPAATSEQPDAPGAELPEKPTMDAVQAGFAKLVPLVDRCFEQHTQARGDIMLTAHTRLTVRIAPDGSIAAREFMPPLAPAVLACSAPKIDAIRFAPSKQGITVSRYVQFTR